MFSGGFLLLKLPCNFKENWNINLLKINTLQFFYVKNAIFVYIRTPKNSGEPGNPKNLEKNLFLFILNKNKNVKNREC